jgi:hypothetical protein
MKSYTDKQILDRVASLPTFKGWPKDKLDIWVRSKADAFNQFDDKCYSYDCTTGTPIFKGVNTGTTNAGRMGLEHYEKYGLTGCAVLKSDTIVYESHAYGLHKGKYPAYVQVKGFPYFRDSDRDERTDEDGREYNNIIGANCHSAGENSTIIEDWSIACMVRNVKAQFNKWMVYMNKKPLTVCILKEF